MLVQKKESLSAILKTAVNKLGISFIFHQKMQINRPMDSGGFSFI